LTDDARFAELGRPRYIWAVAAINGEIERLRALHDALLDRITPGDRVVYLGNYGGASGDTAAVIDELLAFRRHLISQPGMLADDVVYLRGTHEEIWQKLLQIQFASNPREVFAWMVRHGIETTIRSYGSSLSEGQSATRDSAATMTRWTSRLRSAIRQHPGHEKFLTVLRRAAFTAKADEGAILFVHSGLDPSRTLEAQQDNFWWNHSGFKHLEGNYQGFGKVVRGSDPTRNGLSVGHVGITLDACSGPGGQLIAARMQPCGKMTELIEV
jgi:hypothetical protein